MDAMWTEDARERQTLTHLRLHGTNSCDGAADLCCLKVNVCLSV